MLDNIKPSRVNDSSIVRPALNFTKVDPGETNAFTFMLATGIDETMVNGDGLIPAEPSFVNVY